MIEMKIVTLCKKIEKMGGYVMCFSTVEGRELIRQLTKLTKNKLKDYNDLPETPTVELSVISMIVDDKENALHPDAFKRVAEIVNTQQLNQILTKCAALIIHHHTGGHKCYMCGTVGEHGSCLFYGMFTVTQLGFDPDSGDHLCSLQCADKYHQEKLSVVEADFAPIEKEKEASFLSKLFGLGGSNA